MKKLIVAAIMVFAVAALLMVTATPSEAVHGGSGSLTCGQCHTMHSSQGGTDSPNMGTATGSTLLLRVSAGKSISDLCLSCHAEDGDYAGTTFNSGGWATTPPKVLRTGAGALGSGGDFASILSNPGTGIYTPFANDAGVTGTASLGYGHSISNANALLPPGQTGATTITNFACTNCHDPHGVGVTDTAINFYRNLKSGLGDNGVVWTAGATGDLAKSYVGGVAADASKGSNIGNANNAWPMYAAAADQNVYLTGAGNSNMSRFCAQCHGKWHEAITAGNGSEAGQNDWARHPVDAQLVDPDPGDELSVNGTVIVDWANYNAIAAPAKLPAMQVDATGTTYYADADDDKVFCLSCHYAHAGPNFDALRWAYQTTVMSGDQSGISLGSTTGCQQCHNRG